ncbi:MAG: caspase family protein [Bacteroidales bacterium]|nr:caspase family protein [Bacteroidales bacterium]
MIRPLICLAISLAFSGLGIAADKYALLVGCTTYPHDSDIPPLRGSVNDVQLWTKILTDPNGFAFSPQNVTRLVGWPQDEHARPSRKNIVAGFEALIQSSRPGVQIVIVLSGHGTQYPIPDHQDPLDPKNPEPDGLDEVFLPADSRAQGGFPENGILDNEIGAWLDAMKAKGASVLIVFDCCHSGTMTRGLRDDRETPRTILPTHFASQEKIDQAARRAAVATERAQAAGKSIANPDTPEKPNAPAPANIGSVVAFYAAQPYETAPELPMPEGKPNLPEHIHGMLSYALGVALEQQTTPMTYRDLARSVARVYREHRATRPPTPFAEGDLDRMVFGANQWPDRSAITLNAIEGQWRVSAGALRGLAPGTILAVQHPAKVADKPAKPAAHVRIDSVSLMDAVVSSVAYGDMVAVPANALPESGRCTVVSHDLSQMQVKVFADQHPILAEALSQLDPLTKGLVTLTPSASDAEWVLRVVTAQQAQKEFGLANSTTDQVLLMRGDGRAGPANAQDQAHERHAIQRAIAAGHPSPRKVLATYPLTASATLTQRLSVDLPKIFRWQNLWQLSSIAQSTGASADVRFEIRHRRTADDRTGEPLSQAEIPSGAPLLLCLDNQGLEEVWVSVMYADANLGITQVYAGLLSWRPNGKIVRVPFKLSSRNGGDGTEGMVAVMIPKSVQADAPHFSALEQSSFRVNDRGWKAFPTPRTPFERLLQATATGNGTRGDFQMEVKTTPALASQTWVLLPEPAK